MHIPVTTSCPARRILLTPLLTGAHPRLDSHQHAAKSGCECSALSNSNRYPERNGRAVPTLLVTISNRHPERNAHFTIAASALINACPSFPLADASAPFVPTSLPSIRRPQAPPFSPRTPATATAAALQVASLWRRSILGWSRMIYLVGAVIPRPHPSPQPHPRFVSLIPLYFT